MRCQLEAILLVEKTCRPADTRLLQELELEGQHVYFDSLQEIGMEYNEARALELCKTGIERDEFIDRKEFGGPIYQQIDEAYKFVLRHINRGAEINGIVEAWGTGLGRIQKSCREHNLQQPIIEEFGDGFRVVFFRRGRSNSEDNSEMKANDDMGYVSSTEKTASDIESSTEKTANGIESSTKKTASDIESSTEKTANDIENGIETEKRSMGPIEKRLIKLLLKQPGITQQQAADQLGYSKAWIRKNVINHLIY